MSSDSYAGLKKYAKEMQAMTSTQPKVWGSIDISLLEGFLESAYEAIDGIPIGRRPEVVDRLAKEVDATVRNVLAWTTHIPR
jgi:hypothetical protein